MSSTYKPCSTRFYLLMVCVFIYVHWCPKRYPYQMLFVSFNSHMTGVTNRAETPSHSGTSEFTSVLVGVPIAPYLLVVFCISLFVSLYFFFWPFFCVYFFDLWFQVIPLVSSNFSCVGPCVVYDLNHKT